MGEIWPYCYKTIYSSNKNYFFFIFIFPASKLKYLLKFSLSIQIYKAKALEIKRLWFFLTNFFFLFLITSIVARYYSDWIKWVTENNKLKPFFDDFGLIFFTNKILKIFFIYFFILNFASLLLKNDINEFLSINSSIP